MVIFESFSGRSYACSPKALYETMCRDSYFDDYTFVWVFNDPKKYSHLIDARTTLVKYKSRGYYNVYAKAGTWIVNSMIPLDIPKHSDQKLLQCWHGTPLKKMRLDIIKDSKNTHDSYDDIVYKNNIDTSRYDFFISPSRFASRKFTSAFGLDKLDKKDSIIETGYPRNDKLLTASAADKRAFLKKYNIPSGKKIILYAPTWRDDQYVGNDVLYESPVDFEYLREQLSDEYVILFRAHYFVANSFNFDAFRGFIHDVSHVDDINDLYVAADVLVTDYSSVFFDFANLGRPIIFYMYDQEYYKKQLRGFYLPEASLPGEIVNTELQLAISLKDLAVYCKKTRVKIRQFSDEYNYLDDGEASERVIQAVFQYDKRLVLDGITSDSTDLGHKKSLVKTSSLAPERSG